MRVRDDRFGYDGRGELVFTEGSEALERGRGAGGLAASHEPEECHRAAVQGGGELDRIGEPQAVAGPPPRRSHGDGGRQAHQGEVGGVAEDRFIAFSQLLAALGQGSCDHLGQGDGADLAPPAPFGDAFQQACIGASPAGMILQPVDERCAVDGDQAVGWQGFEVERLQRHQPHALRSASMCSAASPLQQPLPLPRRLSRDLRLDWRWSSGTSAATVTPWRWIRVCSPR